MGRGTGGEGQLLGGQPARLRCFLAVDLDAGIIARLVAAIGDLQGANEDVRWVRDAGLHVTLAFLGSVDAARLPAIEAAVRDAVAPLEPFAIEVTGLGAFPNLRRPRVLWAGVRGSGLAPLAAAVVGALAPLGFAAEARPFRGHVTIGRVRSLRGWRDLEPRLRAAEDTDFGRCKVSAVTAYRSDLRRDGAVYTNLWTAEMGERDGSSD